MCLLFILDYKKIVEELVKFRSVSNMNEFYSHIYNIVTQNLDSDFWAIGLFKEKSNCINLRLHDKVGNVYSSKVFLRDIDNPIVSAFMERKPVFKNDVNFLNISYFKNKPIVLLPMISVNRCIGVMILEDKYAKQNLDLYSLITDYVA